jgi:hypothetical protein
MQAPHGSASDSEPRSGSARSSSGSDHAARRARKETKKLCRAARKSSASKLRKYLRRHAHADVNAADSRGRTPLHHAARCVAWRRSTRLATLT